MSARTWLAVACLPLLAGCLNDFDDAHPSWLSILEVDVSAQRVATGSLDLLVNTTIDNNGGRSGDVELLVKAYDRVTGLLEATQAVDVGRIAKDKTVTAAALLSLPKVHGYRISVTLEEDGQFVRRAEVSLSNVAALPSDRVDAGVVVQSLDFLVQNLTSNRVAVEVAVYLTNEGLGPSRPLELQLKAREISTGLLSDERRLNVPTLPTEETHDLRQALEVPARYNYQVEAILWDGHVVVGQGSGTVQLLPTLTLPADQELVVTEPNLEDFIGGHVGRGESEDSAEDVGAPGAPLVLVLVAIAVAVVLRRRNP